MRRRTSPVSQRARSSWVAVLAVALLCLVPVSARAGGQAPHAHAMVHLLFDGADGAVDHHHRHPAAPGHDTAAAAHGQADDNAAPSGRKAAATGTASQTQPPGEDTPTLTPLSSAAVAALFAALIVGIATLPPAAALGRQAVLGTGPRAGHMPAIEPPPPRGAHSATRSIASAAGIARR